MNSSDNTLLARRFFDLLNANDVAGALALMADDATWWLPGKPGVGMMTGNQPKARMAKVLTGMAGKTVGGLKLVVKGTTAEGERVALEMESHAELPNGRHYNQDYHTLVILRDGKIAEVREYMDTLHMKAIWIDA